MAIQSHRMIVLVLSTFLLAGCGALNASPEANAVNHTSTASSPKKTLDQIPLIRQLSIGLNNGQLTAFIHPTHGSRLVSAPISLTAALHNPTLHFGILDGPGWTLVFGAEAPGNTQVLVNGHHAKENPTPPTVKPGYIAWEYFLPGHVKPVVKTAKNT